MNDVGQSPRHGDTEERNAEKNDVKHSNSQSVGQPHSTTVHNPSVRIDLAVSNTHIHLHPYTYAVPPG